MDDGCEECCDACFCAHGALAAVLQCLVLSSEFAAICYWSLWRCSLQLCSLVDLCAALAALRTRVCCMHCRSICTLTLSNSSVCLH